VRVRNALTAGVALGTNPRVVAVEVRRALGTSAVRALTISRTSILGAYRTASLETYRANSDIVTGWIWTAAKQSRTCLACIARDGSEWPLDTFMPAHVNCRCTLRPRVKSWKELGFEGIPERPQPETGAAWFARQPEDVQRVMMGPTAFDLFKQGRVKLDDFVGTKRNATWEASTYQRSLKEILHA
jgi:SPP1 gp7 family putative phage head morphogenesis protein